METNVENKKYNYDESELPKSFRKDRIPNENELPKSLRMNNKTEKISDEDKIEIPQFLKDRNYKNEATKVMRTVNVFTEDELPKSLRKNKSNLNSEEDEFANEDEEYNNQEYAENEEKNKKKKKHRILKRIIKIFIILIILFAIFIFLFFKTDLFQYYKELWVQTAMTTMNHKWLATLFLSEDEINEIMRSLEVQNDEDSILHAVNTEQPKNKENEIKVETIKGSNYVGHVMTISDCSKVKLVDARKKGIGTKLSEICKKNDAIAGINASGFEDPDGNGYGNKLNEPAIINKQLLFGNKTTPMNLIGLNQAGELILGKYTYQEAMNIGIESGLQFGPYIIVNGNNQIKKANAGGLHPRMAIGQKKDGTMIFVCIDGRQPGYSIGATLLELQNIFEKYGAYNAANLDGGSSATMYYEGKVINKTSTPIGERYLPNAFIVTK